MNEEKIVKINGIEISKPTGFKNLQFETSRYSDGLNSIRGFGDMLNEQNLNTIDTVSIDFVLNYYELKELAYIYNLFKANGVLPIENEYLLKKLRSVFQESSTKKEMRNVVYKEGNITHLLCFLNKLSITSIERTNNAYNVNMILTLYDNALTDYEYEEYKKSYNEWIENTQFDEICFKTIDNIVEELKEKSSLDMTVYNVEKLNATYKNHLLNSSIINSKLNLDTEIENELKEQKRLEKVQSKIQESEREKNEYKINKIDKQISNSDLTDSEIKKLEKEKQQIKEMNENMNSVDISNIGTTISIPNHSILQIEMITNNLISNLPIKGSPIGYKSYLGIGNTNFSVKLIFNEYESDSKDGSSVIEQLKSLSDKNLVNHKIELHHPLVQLFDFHTSNILNMTFNNLEEANGIMVNIIFSLNGFRFSEETTINTDEAFDSMQYDNDNKQEEIAGLYLEYVSNYIYQNRKHLTWTNLKPLYSTILESYVTGNTNESKTEIDTAWFQHNYHFIDLLASHSSQPTSFGSHHFFKNNLVTHINCFTTKHNVEMLNFLFNRDTEKLGRYDKNFEELKNLLYLEDFKLEDKQKYSFQDSYFQTKRDMINGYHFYAYIDNISSILVIGNKKYKDFLLDRINTFTIRKDSVKNYKYLLNKIIKPITVEMFNTKANAETDEYKNGVYKKMYDEFLYRLFYIMHINLNSIVDEIKNASFISATGDNILFSKVRNFISKISEQIYEEFGRTLYDSDFIERVFEEITEESFTNAEQLQKKDNKEYYIKEIKKYIKVFKLEFEHQYARHKELFINRAYNIFLTKINYFLAIYTENHIVSMNTDKGTYSSYAIGPRYEKKYNLSINDIIKIYLISSGIQSLFLNKTSSRTDHFGNFLTLGFKNIGYKISSYNNKLDHIEIKKDENVTEIENVMFYQLFEYDKLKKGEIEESKKLNPFSYYKYRIKYDDFFYEDKNLFDGNPNKDINFFYGKKIKQSFLYSDLSQIISLNDKEESDNFYSVINQHKNEFITDNYSESGNEFLLKTAELCKNEFKEINYTDYPYLNFGFIPSHFTELFYNDKDKTFNRRMKQRILGNRDPFQDLLSMANIIYEQENYIMPDYDICIYKKEYKENVGEVFKTINNRQYIYLKNAASISIVKNPKTKIKSAIVVLNNVSKSIFNFDATNGSFDIKSLKNGIVDIVHVEPGDEIRIRVGFDHKTQIFNGFINVIQVAENQLVLNCSSFASLLYNEKISEIAMRPASGGFFQKLNRKFKEITRNLQETLSKVNTEKRNAIRRMHNISNPLNSHLFKFDDGSLYNGVFVDSENASMYSAFNLVLCNLPSFVSEKFVKSKVSEITKGKLALTNYMYESLKGATGSNVLSYQNQNQTYDIYTNINNVDRDYETYGIRKGKEDNLEESPYSINNYKYISSNGETVSKSEDVNNKTENSFSDNYDSEETIVIKRDEVFKDEKSNEGVLTSTNESQQDENKIDNKNKVAKIPKEGILTKDAAEGDIKIGVSININDIKFSPETLKLANEYSIPLEVVAELEEYGRTKFTDEIIDLSKYKKHVDDLKAKDGSFTKREEGGFMQKPYHDNQGYLTIGYGFCIDFDKGVVDSGLDPKEVKRWIDGTEVLTKERADEIFSKLRDEYIESYEKNYLEKRKIFNNVTDPVRKEALLDFTYQNGKFAFLTVEEVPGPSSKRHKDTREFLSQNLYVKASIEILNSLWARQTSNRANRISMLLKYGDIFDTSYYKSLALKNNPEDKKTQENVQSSNENTTDKKQNQENSTINNSSDLLINNAESSELFRHMCLPVDKESNRITSLYREYRNSGRIHKGIDICRCLDDINNKENPNKHKNVYAVADGVIKEISVKTDYVNSKTGLLSDGGLTIILEHDFDYKSAGREIKPGEMNNFYTLYMHLSKVELVDENGFKLPVGTKVKKGQLIGQIGRSCGLEKGCKEEKKINDTKLFTDNPDIKEHLHFEIRIGHSISTGVSYPIVKDGKYVYKKNKKQFGKRQDTKRFNPFDKEALPKHNWNVDWNQVNINAHNGQYTEEWADKYRTCKAAKNATKRKLVIASGVKEEDRYISPNIKDNEITYEIYEGDKK